MRILWAKMGGLWPATTGGRVRSLQILSQLSRRHDVSVITTHGRGDDPRGLERQLPRCQVVSIPYVVPKFGSVAFPLALARSWFSPLPVDIWKWRLKAMRNHVRALLDSGSIDLCVTDFLFAAPNVLFQSTESRPLDRRVPIVLFEHNVEYMIWQRLAAIESRPLHKALFELEWRKLRRFEAKACAEADLTIAVSPEDRRRLAQLTPNGRFASIPTGVDTDYFKPNGRCEVPARMVFTGSMDWHPNEDAVVYFGEAILPRIRAEVPEAILTVVGRNPSDRLRQMGSKAGIEVTGTVDDVRPYMDEAAVYVVPLRAGSGTRLKIFEAMAMAKAVVSTTVGAEGLSITPGREFLLADGPEAFAREVVSLFRDPARRLQLGRAGRRLVETEYSWDHVGRQFEECCETAIHEHEAQRAATDRRVDLPRTGSPGLRGLGILAGKHDELGWPPHHP